jgi:phospholipid/cholesterol/gamma-HCH transport system permease protein
LVGAGELSEGAGMMQHFVAGCRSDCQRVLDDAWQQGGPITLDFSAISRIDGVGAALLSAFAVRARAASRPLRLTGLQPEVAEFLRGVPAPEGAPPAGERADTFLEALGGAAVATAESFVGALVLASELTFLLLDAARGPRRRAVGLRAAAVAREMEDMGAQAVPVVVLIASLVGLTIAMQSGTQLRPYGALVYVVDLIGVSVTRELGPLLAAIVVAGRSGSACAAQLATMVVTEELDALRAMGIEPNAYTVLPKLLAGVLVQPMVALCACAAAIGGAWTVAMLSFGIPNSAFWLRLGAALEARDLWAGLLKSMFFGALIVLVAARSGLAVQGGAEGVGKSTTKSVVRAIFCIIAADALFSFLLYS